MITFKFLLHLYIKLAGQHLGQPFENHQSKLRPCHLSSPEEHHHLSLMPFIQKTPYIPYFQLQIVYAYLRPYLYLFYVNLFARSLLFCSSGIYIYQNQAVCRLEDLPQAIPLPDQVLFGQQVLKPL